MRQATAVDGFRLAYDRAGEGPAVLLLHGWPSDRTDYQHVLPLLAGGADVVVPDLRGFGESDKHPADPAVQYDAAAQARSLIGLIGELGLERPVIGGYDIGSRIAQAIASERPSLVRALVIAPPLPGIGDRVLEPDAQREFWYQPFHQLGVCTDLMDGKPDAVLAYLRHFWTHWSGPDFRMTAQDEQHLAAAYGAPGAFAASIAWYRAGSGTVAHSLVEQAPAPAERIGVPTQVLWPEHDPLFPRAWADGVGDYFSDLDISYLDGAGHFAPREAPHAFAAAIAARCVA